MWCGRGDEDSKQEVLNDLVAAVVEQLGKYEGQGGRRGMCAVWKPFLV